MERSRERHYLKLKLWVPGAEDATRTVVLHYRAVNGLRFFEDHDELYWNITGDEWDVPIEAVSARIELPAVGHRGPRHRLRRRLRLHGAERARSPSRGHAVRVSMPEPLGFHAGVTAVVGWDKGVVAEPTAADRASGFLASNWPLGIPVAGVRRHVPALAARGPGSGGAARRRAGTSRRRA